jgi:hypothetical protein
MGVAREEFKGAKERSQEALGLARGLPGGEPLLNFARNLS